MGLDLTVLKLLAQRKEYELLGRAVPPKAVDGATLMVLKDYGRFFSENPEATEVDLGGSFATCFKLWHPGLTVEQVAVFAALFKRVQAAPDPAAKESILTQLREAAAAAEFLETLTSWNEGTFAGNFTAWFANRIEQLQTATGQTALDLQDRTDIASILEEDEHEWGFSWRLGCLNRHVRRLRPGDFLIYAAMVDTGKTTGVVSEVTNFAPQVDVIWPGEARSILWLINEGPSKRVVERTFQAALRATRTQLIGYKNDGSIKERYRLAMGGRAGVLRVFPVHDMSMADIESKIIRKYKPAMIVYDMLDNVKFDGDVNNSGANKADVLEAMYQRARNQAIKYDCPVIATSQLRAEAEGVIYPSKHDLSNSRVGKSGAAELIITLGKPVGIGLDTVRYVGAPKNKLVRQGMAQSPCQEVVFVGDRGLVLDPDQYEALSNELGESA